MSEIIDLYGPAYHDGIIAALILVAVIAVALLLQRVLFALLPRVLHSKDEGIAAVMLRRAEAPAGFALPLIAALIALPYLTFPEAVDTALVRVTAIASIVAFAWAMIASIGLYTDVVKHRYKLDDEDNLHDRQSATRIDILARTTTIVVVVVSVALAAMTFPSIRAIGTGLLASAGVAGIVIGIAARPLFENLIAGVQLALSQPIRIDDVVVVEGEYGHIEQIAATFVVVRLWDQRRMVLPLTYFIEKPFQNWTRTGAALLGTVFLYVDYSVSLEPLRAELPKILETDKLWDGAVQGIQVTDAKESTVELRILVSARNSKDLFDLRCNVRERMIAFLHEHHATALPTRRQLTVTDPSAAAAAAPKAS